MLSVERFDVGKGIRVEHLHTNKHIKTEVVEVINVAYQQILCKNNTQDIIECLVLKLLQLHECDVGNVTVPGDSNNQICISSSERVPGSFIGMDTSSPKHNTGIFGEVLTRKVIIISNDIEKDPRCMSSCKSKNSRVIMPPSHPHIRKWLGIPICEDTSVLGVLSLARCSSKSPDFEMDVIHELVHISKVLCVLLRGKYITVKDIQYAKDRFLATISHEIRTPLNGILGMITLLPEAGPLNEKQTEYIKNLTECTVELSSLLNNILDFSKMTSDKLELRKNHVDLEKVLNSSINIFEGVISTKNIKLSVHNEIQKNVYLIGDSQRIMQILTNLIGNAVKFTNDEIDIYVHTEKILVGEVPKCKILVTIKDNGVGIPYDEQSKIFEVFHQSSSLSTYMSRSGTGLGLSIVRELVRMMDGKISVESPGINQGSAFTFYILLDEGIDPKEIRKRYSSQLKNLKILVVDDRPDVRLTVCDILYKWSCSPILASSAEEAMHILKYTQPKIALIDICMPNMSGVELAQSMHNTSIYLIGMSSVGSQGEKYFNRYIHKPVDEVSLFDALLGYVNRGTHKHRRRKKPRKSQLKILVCEDNPKNAYTLKELLMSLGYSLKNIHFVENGEECIKKVSSCRYHVVLMDIIMPVMSGLEASRIIKSSLKKKPFIIAISAAIHPSDKNNCQNVGVDGWVGKPIDREKLRLALAPLTRRSRK